MAEQQWMTITGHVAEDLGRAAFPESDDRAARCASAVRGALTVAGEAARVSLERALEVSCDETAPLGERLRIFRDNARFVLAVIETLKSTPSDG